MKVLIRKEDPRLSERQWMALDYAICVASSWSKDGKIFIEPLDPELAEIERLFEPLWTKQGSRKDPIFSGFAVDQASVEAILRNFQASPRAANRIRERLAVCYIHENKLPAELMLLTYRILSGEVKTPRPKAVKPSQIHRDTLLAALAKVIRDETGLPLASNATTLASGRNRPVTASALAGAALASQGIVLTVDLAAKIARENISLITDDIYWGPVLIPPGAPRWGNALASRLLMLDISGKEHFRDLAISWLVSHL